MEGREKGLEKRRRRHKGQCGLKAETSIEAEITSECSCSLHS